MVEPSISLKTEQSDMQKYMYDPETAEKIETHERLGTPMFLTKPILSTDDKAFCKNNRTDEGYKFTVNTSLAQDLATNLAYLNRSVSGIRSSSLISHASSQYQDMCVPELRLTSSQCNAGFGAILGVTCLTSGAMSSVMRFNDATADAFIGAAAALQNIDRDISVYMLKTMDAVSSTYLQLAASVNIAAKRAGEPQDIAVQSRQIIRSLPVSFFKWENFELDADVDVKVTRNDRV